MLYIVYGVPNEVVCLKIKIDYVDGFLILLLQVEPFVHFRVYICVCRLNSASTFCEHNRTLCHCISAQTVHLSAGCEEHAITFEIGRLGARKRVKSFLCYTSAYGQYSSSSSSMPGGAGSKSYLDFLLCGVDMTPKSRSESSGTSRSNSSSVSCANLLGCSLCMVLGVVYSDVDAPSISTYDGTVDGGTYSLVMWPLIVE